MNFKKEGLISLADVLRSSPFPLPKWSLDPEPWKKRAVLWHYLSLFQKARPASLEDLGSEIAQRFDEESYEPAIDWFVPWCRRHWLPESSDLALEVDLTFFMRRSTLEASPPRWHFEYLLESHRRLSPVIVEGGARFAFAASDTSLRVTLPDLPAPDSSEDALESWKRAALKTAGQRVRELEDLRRYRWGGLRAWEALAEHDPRLLKFLELLAMKQALGASYKELADAAYERWEEEISEEGVRQGVRRAAEEIGLQPERIRDAPSGPRPER